jgi:hypothetical protein
VFRRRAVQQCSPVRGLGAAAAAATIGGVGYVDSGAVVTEELVLDTASAAACARSDPWG